MSESITPVAIEDKMRDAYLNYSLSVIVARALPDVRDGLKPVHRRILYAARILGLDFKKPHRKSARIVGEVLGKYHPHGDASVYDAMVRMSQDFNQRYPLIDGHGNFGSIDGDSPAAMRYTEVRLTELSAGLLNDITQDTVDFVDNFDGSLQEPVVLPSRVPNLLINGSSGIAVGMSTDIPPHNLGEVIDGLLHLLKYPAARLETIMKYIPGPDFPTGGMIIGTEGIEEAYRTGKGKLILRAKTEMETNGRKQQIIVTEIPYQLNKSRLIEEMADLVNKGKLENISDLRDESDQDGLRIVLELKSGADSELILNRLYKYSSLQTSYRINMLALVGRQPEVMDLLTIMQHFINYRREVITRRTEYLLNKARSRHHILEGLIKAIDRLDLIIHIIRNSESTGEAKSSLQSRLKITEIQAQAILEMQLQRLVKLETDKLLQEMKELLEKIAGFEEILNNQETLDLLLKEELQEVKREFSDQRRTELIADEGEARITEADLIKEKEAVITLSYRQNIKRSSSEEYARAGKNDYLTAITSGTSLDTLLFFTQSGEVYTLPVHNIPEHHGLSTGEGLKKYLQIPLKEKIINIICLNEERKKQFITIATRGGLVKKTLGSEYETNYSSIKAIKLNEGDQVTAVTVTDGQSEILLATRQGQTIRFNDDSIKATGRLTQGNIGIKLREDDQLINMSQVEEGDYVISISDTGKAKRTPLEEYKLQKRNGIGLKTCGSSIYQMAAVISANSEDYLLVVTNSERLCPVQTGEIYSTKRAGNMYRLLDLNDKEKVSSVYKIPVIQSAEEPEI